MTWAIARVVEREEITHPELRRYVITAAVLTFNVALALLPAVVGVLVIVGVVR